MEDIFLKDELIALVEQTKQLSIVFVVSTVSLNFNQFQLISLVATQYKQTNPRTSDLFWVRRYQWIPTISTFHIEHYQQKYTICHLWVTGNGDSSQEDPSKALFEYWTKFVSFFLSANRPRAYKLRFACEA